MSALTTVIVDDHPLFRQGLKQVIEEDSRFLLVGEAADGNTALDCVRKLRPQLVVLDVNLPGLSGLEVATRITAEGVATRIVMLTMMKEEQALSAALRAGALGYVLKDGAVAEIIDCLLAVSRAEAYVSPALSGLMLRRRARADELARDLPQIALLTTAEKRVLKRIAAKRSTKDIAAEFKLSPRTIEAHRASMCSKLGLRGNNSLMQFALENRDSVDDLA